LPKGEGASEVITPTNVGSSFRFLSLRSTDKMRGSHFPLLCLKSFPFRGAGWHLSFSLSGFKYFNGRLGFWTTRFRLLPRLTMRPLYWQGVEFLQLT